MNPDQHDNVRIVYRPKDHAEGVRRANRMKALAGTPFVSMPGDLPGHKVLFVFEGKPVRVRDIEMVFNDALLCDAVSNWGEDGPLYADTLEAPLHLKAWEYAVNAYAGVELPPQLRNPRKPS